MSVLLKREIFARLKASPKIAQLERGRIETQTLVGLPQSRGWIQDSTQRQNHRKENLQTDTNPAVVYGMPSAVLGAVYLVSVLFPALLQSRK